jgi:hypothetical protein
MLNSIKAFFAKPLPLTIPLPEIEKLKCVECGLPQDQLFRPTLIFWPARITYPDAGPVRAQIGSPHCEPCLSEKTWLEIASADIIRLANEAFVRRGFIHVDLHETQLQWSPW